MLVWQVTFDGRDVVVADRHAAVRHAADMLLGLGGDHRRLREAERRCEEAGSHLVAVGFPYSLHHYLRDRALNEGDDVAFAVHDTSADPGETSVVARYSLRDTKDPVAMLGDALGSVAGMVTVKSWLDIDAEVDDIRARLRAEVGEAVAEARRTGDERVALGLLRAGQDVMIDGVDHGLELVPRRPAMRGFALEEVVDRASALFDGMAASLRERLSLDVAPTPAM